MMIAFLRFRIVLVCVALVAGLCSAAIAKDKKPNFVLIFTDDKDDQTLESARNAQKLAKNVQFARNRNHPESLQIHYDSAQLTTCCYTDATLLIP